MDLLKKQSVEILEQLSSIIRQLSVEEYQKPVEVLSYNSIGKHVRHILEFYEILLSGVHSKAINYDLRKRNPIIEVDKQATLNQIKTFVSIIEQVKSDVNLMLSGNYSVADGYETFVVSSSFSRELMYNVEHAIHHMAIIKIAINSSFKHINVPSHFGIASSTVRFKNQYEISEK